LNNEMALLPYYRELHERVLAEDFVIDKSGTRVVEIIAPRIELNPLQDLLTFNGRKSPEKYIAKEKQWYLSHSISIQDVSDVQIWNEVCDDNGEINSNYGNLVFSRNNFSQFSNVAKSLSNHKESRQGIIIYTRPSIHYEWNSHGCSDFICTLTQQFFIRDDELISVTSMRSSDAIFGVFNDLPFFHHVIRKMHEELLPTYPELEIGTHIFIPNSLHVYERHFEVLRKMVEHADLAVA
jgi:thymidylate synthase